MKSCPCCGKQYNDAVVSCKDCGSTLSDRFSFKGYLKSNFQLFVVLGVFGALAFYSSNFTSKLNQPSSISATLSDSSEISSALTELVLQLWAIICFVLIFVVIVTLIRELTVYRWGLQKLLCFFFLSFLFLLTLTYVLITYTPAIPIFIALFIMSVIFMISYVLHISLVKKFKDDSNEYQLLNVVVFGVFILSTFVSLLLMISLVDSLNGLPPSQFDYNTLVMLYTLLGLICGLVLGFGFYEILMLVNVTTAKYGPPKTMFKLGLLFIIISIIVYLIAPLIVPSYSLDIEKFDLISFINITTFGLACISLGNAIYVYFHPHWELVRDQLLNYF